MSGFVVARREAGVERAGVPRLTGDVEAAFVQKGMRSTGNLEFDDFVVYLFSNDSFDPAQALSTDEAGNFCTYVGTLIYRGQTGSAATAALLSDIQRGQVNCSDNAFGNYCLLVKTATEFRILTDRAGLHHVYHDDTLSFVSNSFVACACRGRRCALNSREALEYVLLGATFGSTSLLGGVSLLEAESEIRLQLAGSAIVSRASVWPQACSAISNRALDKRIAETIDLADDYYGQIALAYRDKVTAALSGGYDSRLSLALLRRHGISPRLFVYGSVRASDVAIAKLICEREGLPIAHVDRDARPRLEPDAYWRNQETTFHGLDGLTQYGYACAPYEFSHRRERVAGGLVSVNGGGGEIWRDFWKLPSSAMSAESFVRAYFGGRFSGLRRGTRDADELLDGIASKIRSLVGVPHGKLESEVVQSLYARLRLRFWQGKNNSVDNHVGHALTPFSEHCFSVPAMTIPVGAKRDGWFERQLICRISPTIAAHPSSYGYNFLQGPGLIDRAKARLVCHVPTSVRIARRRSAMHYSREYYQSQEYVSARFGNGPLEVEKYFVLSELADPLAFGRALTIERILRNEWILG